MNYCPSPFNIGFFDLNQTFLLQIVLIVKLLYIPVSI